MDDDVFLGTMKEVKRRYWAGIFTEEFYKDKILRVKFALVKVDLRIGKIE